MLPLLADQRRRATERLPAEVMAWVETGAGDERTLDEAERAWADVRLRPRVLRDVSRVDTSLTLLGADLRTPVGVAPSALHGLLHETAERGTAAGASRAGALTVVSSRASTDPTRTGAEPWWLQVYVLRDRARTLDRVQAAAAAGARALVVTGDTPYVSPKARSTGPEQVTSRPYEEQQDPSATLDVLAELHDLTGLPVLVKGVLRADDAQACVAAGAAGIVVSNHGGRQLDRAVSTAAALREVASAVDVPVLVDGGLRSGLDVLCALALGADAVLLGRPVAWALAADGADGVAACLDAVTDDLRRAMALAGAARLADVGPDLVAG